jgi:uncharacterized protein YukE
MAAVDLYGTDGEYFELGGIPMADGASFGDRVLATPEAEAAAVTIQQLANNQLLSTLQSLARDCTVLANPDNWDGNLAEGLRDDFNRMRELSDKVHNAVNQLSQNAEAIVADIQAAGN